MINLYEKDNSKEIIEYIGDKYYKALYLYLNYLKYSIRDKEILLYVQLKQNQIRCILLNYCNALHIFSKDNDYDREEIANFIKEKGFDVICADHDIVNNLSIYLMDKNYQKSFGNIFELKSLNDDIESLYLDKIKKAEISDLEELVNFLLEDEKKKKIYSKENLYNQLLNRNLEKYGRNYIIRDCDKIIAHAGTGAENNRVAVINLVMVNKEYRRKGYATSLVKKLCKDLLSENKICYLMTVSSDVESVYEKIGFYKKWTYGKLVKIKEGEKNV